MDAIRVDVFSTRGFVGNFDVGELLAGTEYSLATGALLNLNNKMYCILTVALKQDGTALLEVN